MRLGDWVICVNLGLNACAVLAYAWEGHWLNVLYWVSVAGINMAVLVGLR